MIATLIKDKEHLLKEKEALIQEKQNLQFQLQKFQSKLFAKRSEKWSKDEETQAILFNEIEVHRESEESPIDSPEVGREASLFTQVTSHKRSKPGRTAIPEHFPRTEHTIDLMPEEKICKCGCELTRIGEEISEKVDIIPPRFVVNKTIRPKYVCKKCKGESLIEGKKEVHIAPVGKQFLPKSIADPGFIAYSLIAKFCDGLPFYRLSNIFNRYGFEISRGTLCNYAYEAHQKVKYLEDQFLDNLLGSPFLQIDETPLLVLKVDGEKKTTKSYMFVLRGIHKGKPIIRYLFSPTRSARFLDDFLSRYKGIVQTDGFTSYDSLLATKQNIIHAGCWVHVRREFMDILKQMPTHPECLTVVRLIRNLYTVENEMVGKPILERTLLRDKKSKPILLEIKAWMNQAMISALPSSPFGKALAYLSKQWPKLVHFVDHEFMPPDTNLVENAIRPFVIGRKNWLFSATDDGARSSAFFYSLIETAKSNGKDPYLVLKNLFLRFQDGERPKLEDMC